MDIGAFELQAVDGSSDDIFVAGNDEGFNEVLIFSAITGDPLGQSIDPRFLPDPGSHTPSADSPQALGLALTTGPAVGVSGFSPYSPGSSSGASGMKIAVRVAVGDFNGDGFDDIITAPGPGGGPHVKVFFRTGGNGGIPADVNRFANMQGDINFFAYGSGFSGGVYVAVADINGDGRDDIITAADAGGGSHIRVFLGTPVPGAQPVEHYGFFAYPGFTGGVRLATGDVTGDGVIDIITAPGPGGGPHIRVFDGRNGTPFRDFFAYLPNVTTGIFITVADVNGDRRADIITSPGNGGGSHIQVYDGLSGNILSNFYAYESAFLGGARVAAGDFNQDGLADILTTPGPGGGPRFAFSMPGKS